MPIFRNLSIFFFLIIAGLMTTSTHAAGDAEQGAILASTCLGCHGIPGYRNAYPSYRVPKLGGQHEDYIVIGLHGYKSENRQHTTMQAQTADLSEQNIKDLAAYFSAQGEPVPGSSAARKRRQSARLVTVRMVSVRCRTGRHWLVSTRTISSRH